MKVIVIIFAMTSFLLHAQGNYAFGTNVRVNDDPGGQAFHTTYSSGAHSIAARGDTVYIAYRGDQTGLSSIYFSKSTDCGQTWTQGLRVSYPEAGIIQSLAVDTKGDIFIAYTHIRDPNYRDVHFTKSTDGGLSFSYPLRVNDDTTDGQQHPTIAVDTSGEKVFVAWEDARSWDTTGIDIYFTRSTDGGLTFGPNIRVDDTGNDPSWQRIPGMAVDQDGNNVYIAWTDERNISSGDDIYFTRSTDGGISFLPNVLVNDTATTGASVQWQPTIAVDTLNRIFIAWEDQRQGDYGCHCARSDDGGVSFGNNIKVSEGDRIVDHPSIAVDDSDGVYIVWGDDRRLGGANYRIYFAFSPNAGDSFYANVRVDDLPANIEYNLAYPTLAINQEKKVYIAWTDDRYAYLTNWDIFFALGSYVGIEELAGPNAVSSIVEVVPNPCRNRFTLTSHLSPIKSVCMYDILGAAVCDSEVKSQEIVTCNVAGFHAGVYFVRVETEDRTETRKVILLE